MTPLLEANAELTANISHQVYLNDVVFTTGIAEHEDDFIVASANWILHAASQEFQKIFFHYIIN